MKNGFLKRKNIEISFRRYLTDALGSMALGLFASLLIGTIFNSIGQKFEIALFTDVIAPFARTATGPAIAAAIAYGLQAPPLVLFSTAIVGLAANELGGPVGVYCATLIAVELGKVVSKETSLDIIVTPAVTIITGVLAAQFVGPYVSSIMTALGAIIVNATKMQPLVMGAVVSVVVGMTLTLPISSAAICMMLGLDGLAAGAATVGCCANMIGFAVISYRENGFGGLMAQGIGTSMLQMPNILRNPRIWIPSIAASAVLGPVSTMIFKMENIPIGAGMGTCGLVGQVGTIAAMGEGSEVYMAILLLHFILPALISLFVAGVLRKWGWIRPGDMKLDL